MAEEAKKTKKKNKKKAADASQNGDQLDEQTRLALKLNPNASAASDGWLEVKVPKKLKQQERLKRKMEASAESKEQGDAVLVTAPSASTKDPTDYVTKRQTQEQQRKKQQQSNGSKKLKDGKKKTENKKPVSENDLAELIGQILDATPLRYLTISGIGDKVQAVTKQPWNTIFKPKFGSLKDFVQTRPQYFFYDEVLDRVYIKKEHDALQAQRASDAAGKAARKAAKKAQADTLQSVQETSPARGSDPWRAASVVALVAVAAAAAAYFASAK